MQPVFPQAARIYESLLSTVIESPSLYTQPTLRQSSIPYQCSRDILVRASERGILTADPGFSAT